MRKAKPQISKPDYEAMLNRIKKRFPKVLAYLAGKKKPEAK